MHTEAVTVASEMSRHVDPGARTPAGGKSRILQSPRPAPPQSPSGLAQQHARTQTHSGATLTSRPPPPRSPDSPQRPPSLGADGDGSVRALPPQLGGGLLTASPRATSPLQAVYNPLLSPSITPRSRVRQVTSVR